ncbi:hypothetical protein HOG48_06135 [Candidatus Peregrinibacteria bacterium]|mgnify:CR=1 FL=1|jgi:hypothetical protein|nr:hypothetical protein [Candidatus Peregrinibacteria bacterium]
MMKVKRILETKEVERFLKSRGLLKQYKKAKRYLLEEHFLTVCFKERRPKGSGIWYFRINKQYRAYGMFNENDNLVVFEINDHQNG